jgi:hypothetical protein
MGPTKLISLLGSKIKYIHVAKHEQLMDVGKVIKEFSFDSCHSCKFEMISNGRRKINRAP